MSSRSKKLKIDPNEEFCFNSNNNSKSSDTFSFESLKLCCLFWQNFNDYNRKIDEEKLFHYPHFEFIIFQLTVYIQQNNINNYELYSNYSSPSNSSSGEISTTITTKEIKTSTSTVTSTTITQQQTNDNNNNNNNNLPLFGGNFFENSSIFSMVSMVYKPSTSNAEKQLSSALDSLDNQIIVTFGSLEYKPVNNNKTLNNNTATVGCSTSISSPENNVRSTPLPIPSFRTLEEEEECKVDEDDEDIEEEDTYEQIMREINHSKQLFKLAKLQYIKMLESKDERHLDCPAICHIHCSHTTLPQLRILYKLKELFVNHANDMLSLCSSLPPRPM